MSELSKFLSVNLSTHLSLNLSIQKKSKEFNINSNSKQCRRDVRLLTLITVS